MPSKKKKPFLGEIFEVEDLMTREEVECAIKICRKFGVLNEFLQHLPTVSIRQFKEQGFVDCYLWPQTMWEIGYNYSTGKKITKKIIEDRLKESREVLTKCRKDKTLAHRLTYWDGEVSRLKEQLAKF